MKYTVRCFRPTARYRTTVVVLSFDSSEEVWDHIHKCPHGHEVKSHGPVR